jgi:hypothetical protein
MTVLVVAVAALVTGCSADEPQPSAQLPPASSSSAEPTPELPPLGPKDLPMPAGARVKDESGAEAFLRYYMDVYNHAQRTMDSTFLRQFSSECRNCDRISNDLDMDAGAGYTYKGGSVRLDGVSKPALNGTEAQLVFAIRQEALVVLKNGKPVEGLTFPANSSTTDGAILRWRESQKSWLITQWDAA